MFEKPKAVERAGDKTMLVNVNALKRELLKTMSEEEVSKLFDEVAEDEN